MHLAQLELSIEGPVSNRLLPDIFTVPRSGGIWIATAVHNLFQLAGIPHIMFDVYDWSLTGNALPKFCHKHDFDLFFRGF